MYLAGFLDKSVLVKYLTNQAFEGFSSV